MLPVLRAIRCRRLLVNYYYSSQAPHDQPPPTSPPPPDYVDRSPERYSVTPFIHNARSIINKAKEHGLQVRPDGFVNVAEMKKYPPFTKMAIRTFVDWFQRANRSFTLVREPELHAIGGRRNQLIWWVRKTRRLVPKGIDQADFRIKPDTSVRNAIYKATRAEWEDIRKHGIKLPEGSKLITMFSIDKIDETTGPEGTSHVYIFVDMRAAMQRGGVEFYFTRYHRVVSPGDKDGTILPRYFSDAIEVTVEKRSLLPTTGG